MKSDYLTHHNPTCDQPWIAIHIPSARKALSGYKDANFEDIGELMCNYCNLLERYGLVGEGMTEDEAIQNAKIITA